MRHQFTNNSVATLDGAITNSATTFDVVDEPAAYSFEFLTDAASGKVQPATLENKTTAPGVVEIVYITEHNGLDFTVVRGREGTSAVAWADGTKLSARITAGILQTIPQNQEPPATSSGLAIAGHGGVASTGGANAVAISAVARGDGLADSVLIGGFPVLQSVEEVSSTTMDRITATEVYGGTMVVDLGAVPTWATSTNYSDGDVVKPTSPDGFQYTLRIGYPPDGPLTSGTQPTWPASTSSVPFAAGNDTDFWFGVDVATGITQAVPSGTRFYPTEVGFICFERTASTDPTVSIGTTASATKYANAVALTSIDGSNYIHRIPVTDREGVTEIVFKLAAAATGGVVRGRFYYKGLFVQDN